MIKLLAKDIEWIDGLQDNPVDLCAHAQVVFEINGKSIIREENEYWTVSAAALYLLRSLENNHTKEAPLFEHLIPCCGMVMGNEEANDMFLIGCCNGIDFQIIHSSDMVEIISELDESFIVPKHAWLKAVIGFSKAVRDFYFASSPKQATDSDEAYGFRLFMTEWDRRHRQALAWLMKID